MKYVLIASLPMFAVTEMPYQEISIGGVCAVLLWMIARDRKEHGVALLATNIATLTMQKMLLVMSTSRHTIAGSETYDEETRRLHTRVDIIEGLIDEQIASLKDALK